MWGVVHLVVPWEAAAAVIKKPLTDRLPKLAIKQKNPLGKLVQGYLLEIAVPNSEPLVIASHIRLALIDEEPLDDHRVHGRILINIRKNRVRSSRSSSGCSNIREILPRSSRECTQ